MGVCVRAPSPFSYPSPPPLPRGFSSPGWSFFSIGFFDSLGEEKTRGKVTRGKVTRGTTDRPIGRSAAPMARRARCNAAM